MVQRAQILPPLDLEAVIRIVRGGRFLMLEGIVLFILFSLVFIHLQRPLYTAIAIVAPQESSQASIQSGSTALQALGSLSGLSLGKTGGPLDEFMETLDTPLVASGMQARYSMLQKVFPGSWDAANRRWKTPSGTRHWIGRIVNDVISVPQPRDPDIFSLAGYVTQSVKSIKDRNTGFVTFRYSSTDPQFSTYFLKTLFSAADASMRDADKRRAAVNVNFLQDKLQTVQSTDLRQALIALLEDQEKSMMLANSGETYAFRYVQPPITSNSPTWPASIKILVAAAVLGLALGLSFSAFLYWPEVDRRPSWVSGIRRSGSMTAFLAGVWR